MKRQMTAFARVCVWLCSPLLLLSAVPGGATPLRHDTSLSLGAEYHNNIDKRASDEKSDVEQFVGLDLNVLGEGARYDIDLGYAATYTDFLHDRQDDKTAVDGRAQLNVKLVKRRVRWFLTHQASEDRTDRSDSTAPDNLEQRSIFTTGLHLSQPVGSTDSLYLVPRYSDIRFSESEESDSTRGSVGGGWSRQISSLSSFSLNGNYNDVSFDNEVADYESWSARVDYSVALSRSEYRIEVGYNEVEPENFESTDGGLLGLYYALAGKANQVNVALVHELTDTSVGLSAWELNFDGGFDSEDSNFDDIDIVEKTQFEVRHSYAFGHGSELSWSASATNEDYQYTQQDEKVFKVGAGYLAQMSDQFSLRLMANVERIEFSDDPTGREHDEYEAQVTAIYNVLPNLAVELAVGGEKRESNVSAANEYEDLFASLSFDYSFNF